MYFFFHLSIWYVSTAHDFCKYKMTYEMIENGIRARKHRKKYFVKGYAFRNENIDF